MFFVTEKINLPREKVVKADSANSSPSHGFMMDEEYERNNKLLDEVECKRFEDLDEKEVLRTKLGNISEKKVGKVYLEKILGNAKPPKFDDQVDYYKEFWRMFL